MVHLDSEERKGLLDPTDSQDHLDLKVHVDRTGREGLPVSAVSQGNLDHLEAMEDLDQQGQEVNLDHQDHQDHRDFKVQEENVGNLDRR